MTMPIAVDYIIQRLGGAEAAARLTGVGTEAVRKWRQNNAIPTRHWPAVIAVTGLSLADLQTFPEQTPPHQIPPQQKSPPMTDASDTVPAGATAALVLADGSVLWGRG